MNRSLLSVTRFFSFPLLLLLGSWFCIPAFALDGDENWDDGYGLPGFDESVQQIVVAADEVVVGLSLVVALLRRRPSLSVDDLTSLRG